MNILVIFGGKSVEHEISILTGMQIIEGLKELTYRVFPLYITKENETYLVNNPCINDFAKQGKLKKTKVIFTNKGIRSNKFIKIDIAVIALHGTFGEDGIMASILEFYNIPFVGSNHITSSAIQDKIVMKEILSANGIRTLPFTYLTKDSDTSNIEYPVIIKPSTLGSSIGISVVYKKEELDEKLRSAFKYSKRVLIEKYVPRFREMNCAVRGYKNPEVSKIEEVYKSKELLSYKDKYESKSSKKKAEAIISNSLKEEIIDISKKCFEVFDIEGVARIDFMVISGTPYVNEINSIPGSLAFYLFTSNITSHLEFLFKCVIKKEQEKNKLIYSHSVNILSLSGKK